jgi:hypothetical protein
MLPRAAERRRAMDKQNENPGIHIPKSVPVLKLFNTISNALKTMSKEDKEEFCLTMAEIVLLNVHKKGEKEKE